MNSLGSKKVLQKLIGYILHYLIPFLCDPTKPFIIYYHRVISLKNINSNLLLNPLICIDKRQFESQIRYLSRNANVITMDEFIEGYICSRKLPRNSVLITFDDGYVDNFQHAFPILKKYKVPATIFLTSDVIGTPKHFWWDVLHAMVKSTQSLESLMEALFASNLRNYFNKEEIRLYRNCKRDWRKKFFAYIARCLQRMKQEEIDFVLTCFKNVTRITESTSTRSFLSWEEVSGMANYGISFGSHSSTHPNLTLLSEKELFREFEISKKKIEEKIGTRVEVFSYPFGLYDEKCKRIAEKSGYKVAFATNRSNVSLNPFSIPRTQIKEGRSLGLLGDFSKNLFEVEYHGLYDKLNSKLSPVTHTRLRVS